MESFLSLLNSVDISNHSELETIAVGTGQQNRDCDALFQSGTTTSGVQTIAVRGNSLEVYCQMNTHGHNWIVSSECTIAVYWKSLMQLFLKLYYLKFKCEFFNLRGRK